MSVYQIISLFFFVLAMFGFFVPFIWAVANKANFTSHRLFTLFVVATIVNFVVSLVGVK